MSVLTPADLLGQQLRTLYGAELQLLATIPRLLDRVSDPRFAAGLAEHRLATEGHVIRLETCFAVLSLPTRCDLCHGMSGLLRELQDDLSEPVTLGSIGLANRCQLIERFELVLYANARLLADALDELLIVRLLDHTMAEERAAEALWLTIASESLGADRLVPRGIVDTFAGAQGFSVPQ